MQDYIPIDSIDDIDPRRVSIRDLNKKYIDREGNRYATRFNIKTREVEIVRLAKTIEEARRLQIKIRNEKTGGAPPETDYQRSAENTESAEDYYVPQDIGSSGPAGIVDKDLLDDCVQEIGKARERQQAVLNSIRKNRIFEQGYDGFAELTRRIDTECWQAGDEAINYYKELFSYPRPVTHYLSRLEPDNRTWVESLGDEESRMELVKRLEMYRTFHGVFQNMYSVTTDLKGMLEEMPEEAQASMAGSQTMAMRDALPSLEIIQENCLAKMASLDDWYQQVQNG
jgi:hypothetical protein